MTMTSAEPVIARDIPRPDRHEAFRLFNAELPSMVALLESLSPAAWDLPTDCSRWTVRHVVAHLIGAFEGAINPVVTVRRLRQGGRRYPELAKLDGYNEVQVDARRDASPAQLIEAYARLAPKAARSGLRLPSPIRRLRVSSGLPGVPRLSLGYLCDVIALRDAWMHRVDISQATGTPFIVGAADRAVVEQVVRDLAVNWSGTDVVLELSGQAGGRWQLGAGAPPQATVRVDAVQYMRTLAGRHDDPDLQVVAGDPGIGRLVAEARVLF